MSGNNRLPERQSRCCSLTASFVHRIYHPQPFLQIIAPPVITIPSAIMRPIMFVQAICRLRDSFAICMCVTNSATVISKAARPRSIPPPVPNCAVSSPAFFSDMAILRTNVGFV